MSTGIDALSSATLFQNPPNYLHKRSLNFFGGSRVSGFSLIEVLLVILVMGILCAAGISLYAGVTEDTQTRTRNDELNSFFSACRYRAMLRKTPVSISFSNSMLTIAQSNTLRLRLPDLDPEKGASLLNGLKVNTEGKFSLNEQTVKQLNLPFKTAGNRINNIIVEL